MKIWKSLFCSILCCVLVLAVVQPIRSAAVTTATVYLDPAGGSDSADGLSENTAVKTYDTAYGKIKTAGGGTIVFLSTLKITQETQFPSSDEAVPVVLTSKTGAEGISSGSTFRFGAPTKLENMTVALTTASTNCTIYGEGKKLTIGENVNSVGTGGYYFSLAGGKRYAKCESADVTVQSGTWQNIYVGTYGYKSGTASVSSNANLTMTGGSVVGMIAPAYGSETVMDNVNIRLSHMSVARIFSAPVKSGRIAGDVNVTLGEGVEITGGLYAGGNGTGSVTGTVTFCLDGADTADMTKISSGGASGYTGTVGAVKMVLSSGVLSVIPSKLTSLDIDIPEGKTLTLSQCTLTADTVRCAGTLAFSGAVKLDARQVEGTVNCAIMGNVFPNHPYITAPAGSGFVFAQGGVLEDNGVWIKKDLESFQGLVLTAAKGVKVTLYTGFDPDTAKKVDPYAVDGNTQYYPALQGNYYYTASGVGYYRVKKNIYMSPEKATTKTVIDATPGKISGLGWEPSNATVKYYTDEFLKNAAPSDKALWPEFGELFTTPAFGENRAEHQHTTQVEMEAFIAGLDDAGDNMYVYSMGTSGRGQNMPLVIFTRLDLTGKTLEEAAALIVADSEVAGKLTVHHQAHIHGNEQAAGEAALGLIKMLDGAYGESMLDSLNIYVMPRQNPDGAEDNIRRIPTWGQKDPNTDFAQLETKEVQNIVRMMNLFKPHVVIDNHEGNVAVDNDPVFHGYMLTNARYSVRNSQAFQNLGQAMVMDAHNTLRQRNFAVRYIDNIVNGKGIGTILGYAGNQGILAFLIESPGIAFGCNSYERRVVGAMICITTYYDYLKENLKEVKTIITAEQQRICDAGKTFEESDQLALELAKTKHEEFAYPTPYYNAATGAVKEIHTLIPEVWDTVVRSRVAPTAYVLPAGEDWVADVLTIMDRHGISYQKLPAGSRVLLRQYTGSHEVAELTDETAVSFPNGAYVFTMNTQKAEILTNLLEPDMTNTARTLTSGNGHYTATSGETHTYIAPVDGVFPIYRYEHDLNAQGCIDYVAQGKAGDFTGDGGVTDGDAVYLLRHTLFPGEYPLNGNGDINGDGILSDADAVYLLRHTLFPDEYPLNV